MKLSIYSIGKTKQPALAQLEELYCQRLRNYFPVELFWYKSDTTLLAALEKSASFIIALDEHGTEYTSQALAQQIKNYQVLYKEVIFVLGDAPGLPLDIITIAKTRVALSTMTFPHEFARVMLLEQLYRSGTILAGHPYHK
jgi:23S rRNA (pseudouridine1915-N3)-methyltransferase